MRNLESLPSVAADVARLIPDQGVVCFWGGMGVGKTTFIRALCKYWGVQDDVVSPTFALVNEYHTPNQCSVLHMDFYRIESLEEAMAIGAEEYFYREGSRCLVEWPALVDAILPPEHLDIWIQQQPDGKRTIVVGDKPEV